MSETWTADRAIGYPEGVPRPKDSDSALVHDRILAAATASLESVGPSALTMRRIAEAADVSLGTLHYYFDTKDALLEAVFDALFADVYRHRDELIRGWNGTGSPEALLENAVRLGYRTALRMRAASRLSQIMALDHGFIPRRRSDEEDVALEAWASLVENTLGTSPVHARLLIKSLLFCIGRYATSNVEELRRVTGLPSDAGESEIHAAIEDHLVLLTRALAHT